MRHNEHSTAIIHSESRRRFTYGELVNDVAATKSTMLEANPRQAPGSRVAMLVENGYDYVGMLATNDVQSLSKSFQSLFCPFLHAIGLPCPCRRPFQLPS